MAGLDLSKSWEMAENKITKKDTNTFDLSELFKTVSENGLVAGLLQLSPIQLGETETSMQSSGAAPAQQQHRAIEQMIIYLDEDFEILKTNRNHVTINIRTC